MQLLRRTFLQVSAAVGGLLMFKEPLAAVEDQGDWIEDRGAYAIVRVPAGKTFDREKFNKPLVLYMGDGSTLKDVECNGFVNLIPNGRVTIKDSVIDSRLCTTAEPRPAMNINQLRKSEVFFYGQLNYGPHNSSGILVVGNTDLTVDGNICGAERFVAVKPPPSVLVKTTMSFGHANFSATSFVPAKR